MKDIDALIQLLRAIVEDDAVAEAEGYKLLGMSRAEADAFRLEVKAQPLTHAELDELLERVTGIDPNAETQP